MKRGGPAARGPARKKGAGGPRRGSANEAVKKLRRRLTLICAVLTSCVLAALMTVIAVQTEKEYRGMRENALVSQARQVASRLQTGESVDNSWLMRLEVENRFIIHIEDNGQPLFFRGGWSPLTGRETIIARALLKLEETGGAARDGEEGGPQPVVFSLRGDEGERYRCAAMEIPAAVRGGCDFLLLAELLGEDRAVAGQRTLYAGLSLVGAALFSWLGWFLAGVAVRPVEESMAGQSAFVASASHELRSPLALIRACAGAVSIDPQKAQGYLDTIAGECDRMGRLVTDLLLLSGADSRTWTLRRETLYLDTLLIEAVEELDALCREKGHTLRLELLDDEEWPPFPGDSQRLRQVITNLVVNAASYAGGSEEILVRGARREKELWIQVADHGAGIPDQEKEKVLQRFYRADKARGDKSHFGLGLPIAWELTRLHGGRLTLGDTPGGGCTVTLIFPLDI